MRLKIIIGFLALGLGFTSLSQQRAITSTYPYNLLMLNPAYAGSLNMLSVIGVYRAQWINQDGAPETSILSAHSSFFGNRVGIGLYAINDRIGVHTDNSVYASYAYKIRTPIGILAMGLQGGFNYRESDFTELTILDRDDPLLNRVNTRFSPNFGTGIYFANPNLFAGFSVPYILENKTIEIDERIVGSTVESRESRYYYATAGIIFPISSNIKVSPSILIRGQEDNRPAFDITGNLIFDDIAYVGVSVRNNGELTFLGQLILNENFRVGYAYDVVTRRDQTDINAGTHEIMLNYRIRLKNTAQDPLCPVYF